MDEPESTNKDVSEEVFRLWDAYREYVVHEDTLFNQRLSRMLLVQGVLFTAGGTMITEFAKGVAQMQHVTASMPDFLPRFGSIPVYATFLFLIALVGVVTARLSGREVQASDNALQFLDEQWTGKVAQAHSLGLPGLLGAGNQKATFRQTEGFILPVVFVVIWCILGLAPIGAIVCIRAMGYSLPVATQTVATPVQVTCTSSNPSGNAISTRRPSKSILRR